MVGKSSDARGISICCDSQEIWQYLKPGALGYLNTDSFGKTSMPPELILYILG